MKLLLQMSPAKKWMSIALLLIPCFVRGQAVYIPSGEQITVLPGTTLFVQSGETTVAAGGTFTVNGTFSTKGNFTNNGSLVATSGVLEFNGTSQNVAVGGAVCKTVNIGSSATTTLTNAMVIPGGSNSGTVTVAAGGQLNSNGYLMLKSNASGTAMIAQGSSSGNYITGDVIVERYIPAKRAFRILSPSVTTTTSIYANWQEGGSNASGYGTHITGSTTGASGFDATSSGNPSLFEHNNSTLSWSAVSNTNAKVLTAGSPLRIMVRGDRTIDLSNQTATPTTTILRSTGTIGQGDITVANLNQTADAFSIVGNPYPASVNMASVLANATNVNSNYYYIWDPNMNTRGAYVTVVVSNGSNAVGSAANEHLQPGQACFVKTVSNGSASLVFKESYKSSSITNTFKTLPPQSLLTIRMYQRDSMAKGKMAADAIMLGFDPNFNSDLDQQDALKAANQDENLSISSNQKLLSIENRNLPAESEIIPLNLLRIRDSKYVFRCEFLGDLQMPCFLYDQFKDSFHLLNKEGVTLVSVDMDTKIAGSIAENRFSLVTGSLNAIKKLQSENNNLVQIIPNPIEINQSMIMQLNKPVNGHFNVETIKGERVATGLLVDGNFKFNESWNPNNGIYLIHWISENNQGQLKLVVR